MAAKNRNTFEKLQRESQKKRKAALKRLRREERKNAAADDAATVDAEPAAEDRDAPAGSLGAP